ncbi:MAG: LA_3696 family protein [Bacteroidota bacterium]
MFAVPKAPRERLGEDGADALMIDLINQSQSDNKADILQFVEDKFEKRLAEEMSKVDERITEEIPGVPAELANARADFIKWLFILPAGQIGAMIGILLAFFKWRLTTPNPK